MATIYCSNCGAKADYQYAPPNFCGKCGVSYSGSTPKASLSSSRRSIPSRRGRLDDDVVTEDDEGVEGEDGNENTSGPFFSDSNRVPRISRLAVEIDSTTNTRSLTIGDLIREAGGEAEQGGGFQVKRARNINDLRNERNS